VEVQESSKAAKLAYEKFSAEADSHAKEIEKQMALKDEKYAGDTPLSSQKSGQCCSESSSLTSPGCILLSTPVVHYVQIAISSQRFYHFSAGCSMFKYLGGGGGANKY
jgi:hypothetical protein